MLESKQADRIKGSLQKLKEDPFVSCSGADIKKLVSVDDPPLFRLRIGDYRAIYFVDGKEMKVTQIIHRSKGYKWLE